MLRHNILTLSYGVWVGVFCDKTKFPRDPKLDVKSASDLHNLAKLDVHKKEWFIKAPWGKISVVAWGDSSKQPVVMCHGKQDSAATFQPLIEHLPDKFYYISFDLPGNGRSDHFPKGLPLTVFDFVYSLKTLVDHFQWDKFAFMGHSLGSNIGRLYHLSYPNRITGLIDLDPTPAYTTYEVSEFSHWYEYYLRPFYEENYVKFNATSETAPKYTYEKIFELLKKARGLTNDATTIALERILQPVGDGLYEITMDQRMKLVTLPPFSSEYLQEIYASISVPILTSLAKDSIKEGCYDKSKFLLDKNSHKSKNYFVETVEGNHDVHLSYPERIAPHICEFLTAYLDNTIECKVKSELQ